MIAFVVVLAALTACGQSARPVVDNTADTSDPQEARVEPWSAPVDGIRIRINPPNTAARAGDTLTMTLLVENTGDRTRRIYLLGPEVFRATLSDLTILGTDGKPVGMSQPDPHPHGYLPREDDFPLIAAGSSRRFAQSLQLPPTLPAGAVTVVWDLSNRVTRMPGGVQTLDGVTTPLFGGGDIPDIWVGEVRARTQLVINH